MKIWTYEEARDKLLVDLDLQDEDSVMPSELVGYFNEGIKEAEAEILKVDEDYFLKSKAIPLVTGTDEYAYPSDLYGFKIRGIQYSNGSIIYPVRRVGRGNKFDLVAMAAQYGASDDYVWYHKNASAGQARIVLIPPSRETAVVLPLANPFQPMNLWYIRHASRVPILGEWVPEYEQLDSAVDVSASGNSLAVAETYATADAVKLTTTDTMPGGLVSGTIYYTFMSAGVLKLATTAARARAGTVIDITTAGTGVLSISIQATQAIIDAIQLDIPEFVEFVIQWAKCRCLSKEGDPRWVSEVKVLEQQRAQMVATLSTAHPDDENEVQGDFSAYTDMS